MKPLQHRDPVFEQLFDTIPTEICQSFTFEQIEAITRAFSSRSWKRHPLDIRVSLPILELRFYMVLLAGRERRSKERLRVSRMTYPLWSPTNILFIIGFFIVLLFSVFSTTTVVLSSLSSISISPHPTSLPFIENQDICERTGRTWSDGKCWDSEHNPLF